MTMEGGVVANEQNQETPQKICLTVYKQAGAAWPKGASRALKPIPWPPGHCRAPTLSPCTQPPTPASSPQEA